MGIRLNDCPRCTGAVVYGSESPFCLCCGWRRENIKQDVLDEVEKYLGQPDIGSYIHNVFGTGKPAISGWEGVKRKRERERMQKCAS